MSETTDRPIRIVQQVRHASFARCPVCRKVLRTNQVEFRHNVALCVDCLQETPLVADHLVSLIIDSDALAQDHHYWTRVADGWFWHPIANDAPPEAEDTIANQPELQATAYVAWRKARRLDPR